MIEEDARFRRAGQTVYVATVNEGGKLQLEIARQEWPRLRLG